MDFELGSDERLLQETVRRFAEAHVLSGATLVELAELGMLEISGALELSVALEELGRRDASLAMIVLAANAFPETSVAAAALSDEGIAATRQGDTWRLRGSALVPWGGEASRWALLAGDDAFVIDAVPSLAHPEPLLGLMSARCVSVELDGLMIPEACRRPRPPLLALGVAAIALGVGEAALAAARSYARERRQFGQAIADFQAIQWKLADSATELAAARLMTRLGSISQAKLFATDAALKVTDEALQIHGGLGFTTDLPIERYYRDAQVLAQAHGSRDRHSALVAEALLRA
jgi:alkylation response protein AidB-like acyl-CoA dehydrogenase